MFDGGSRGNPGIAGSGAYITTTTSNDFECTLLPAPTAAQVTTRHVVQARHYVGPNCTNNEAEYDGLCTGLAIALEQVQDLMKNKSGPHNATNGGSRLRLQLIVEGDSQLIIRQLTGVYACKHVKLKPLHAAALTYVHEIQNLVQQQQQQQQPVNSNSNNKNDHHPNSSTTVEVQYQHVLRAGNTVADGTSRSSICNFLWRRLRIKCSFFACLVLHFFLQD
jgi:ribonuclease HI